MVVPVVVVRHCGCLLGNCQWVVSEGGAGVVTVVVVFVWANYNKQKQGPVRECKMESAH